MAAKWIVLSVLVVAATVSEVVVVKREGARVMKAPRFFGDACPVDVSPGQSLTVVERRGGWARLASPGNGQCWLHQSAWSDRQPGELVGNPATASQRDVELAGRGFTEEEEERYRSDHPDLAPVFGVVEDYLARAPETPSSELAAFLAAGRLGGDK